jgi:hypothetical protein
VTPVLTTNLRSTQTLDPTGVARAQALAGGACAVTAPAYRVCTPGLSLGTTTSRPKAGLASAPTATTWSANGLEIMPKVDFHDRWPLHSTS